MESKTVPKLVNPENFILQPEIKIKNKMKWNLNKILLILFAIFLVFFLYNCKYGMFKGSELEPSPYSLGYNNSLI